MAKKMDINNMDILCRRDSNRNFRDNYNDGYCSGWIQ